MRNFTVTVNGVPYKVEVQDDGEVENIKPAAVPSQTVKQEEIVAPAPKVESKPAEQPAAPVSAEVAAKPAEGETAVTAPMPGKIIQTKVNVGDMVKAGDVVVILEAMKMQNEIKTTVGGQVKAVNVASGQSVKPGEAMLIIG